MNYSKWDKMVADMDEDSDEEVKRRPHVTRLEKPSQITIGDKTDPGIKIITAADTVPKSARQTASLQAISNDGVIARTHDGASARTGVDYSKWDKMALDVSDSDEEEQDEEEGDPGMQDLADEGIFVVDEDRTMQAPAFGAAAAKTSESEPEKATITQIDDEAESSGVGGGSNKAASQNSSPLTRNGAITDTHLWSQDKKQVVLSLRVPADTRSKMVKVTCLEKRLTVNIAGHDNSADKAWMDKQLAYPVVVDREDGLDWELKDSPEGRLLQVTLCKLLPGMSNLPALQVESTVVLWWRKVFEGDAEIDVSKLQDRAPNREANAQAWKQAHEQFREMVKNRQPVELDIGGNGE